MKEIFKGLDDAKVVGRRGGHGKEGYQLKNGIRNNENVGRISLSVCVIRMGPISIWWKKTAVFGEETWT